MSTSTFAKTIMEQKYAHTLPDGTKETWEQVAKRVATNVMAAVEAPASLVVELEKAISEKKFMPGGRYLYASGRSLHQTQNCLLLKAEDSREGWSDLMQKASMALMTGAGIGVVYSDIRPEGAVIHRTGGFATGPLALMQMVNEAGRFIMQGGSRRSAIWAGLHWNHQDVVKFVSLKNWREEVRELKTKDYNFPATLDGTNISVILDDDFFSAYNDEAHQLHSHAQSVYWAVVRQMLKTAEPGFSVDVGANNGENLRNAPVCGDTHVLTSLGYKTVSSLLKVPATIWTGLRWAKDVQFKETSPAADIVKVNFSGGRSLRCEPSHPFIVQRFEGRGSRRIMVSEERVPAADLQHGDVLKVSLPQATETSFDREAYTIGFVHGDGSVTESGRAEVTLCTERKSACRQYFEHVRSEFTTPEGYLRVYFKGNWSEAVDKRALRQFWYESSPSVRASFLAGLFDADGSYDSSQHRIRLSSVNRSFLRDISRLLESIGILSGISSAGQSGYGGQECFNLVVMADYVHCFRESVPVRRLLLDSLDSYESYRDSHIKVISVTQEPMSAPVYCADVKLEEHSFMAEGVIISNCTEVTSRDDSDICNLGSINMANVSSLEEMKRLVEIGTAFLLAGTVYSDLPYAKVDEVRRKNRRLGLGLMGLHEWLLKKGKKYAADAELGEYLAAYAESTEIAAKYAAEWDLSAPVKTRAIAPTGTIGIVAETTTGIEPIFCVAYKRRYLKGSVVNYQYVIDPTAQRLIESGVNPDSIEDAYTLANNVEARVAFQAWVQTFVDHSISSTINLPEWGSALNNDGTVREFGEMLIKYLPGLRGVTCYPDGARGGQPLTPVRYNTAIKHVGQIFIEQADVCDITKGGSCGV